MIILIRDIFEKRSNKYILKLVEGLVVENKQIFVNNLINRVRENMYESKLFYLEGLVVENKQIFVNNLINRDRENMYESRLFYLCTMELVSLFL